MMTINNGLLWALQSHTAALRGPKLARFFYGNPNASTADDASYIFLWAADAVDDKYLRGLIADADGAEKAGMHRAAKAYLLEALNLIDEYMLAMYTPTLFKRLLGIEHERIYV